MKQTGDRTTTKFSLHTPFHIPFTLALPLRGVCNENVVERNRITSTQFSSYGNCF